MEEMAQDLKLLEREVSGMKVTLGEIHTAIIGNPLSKDGGMVLRLENAEQQIEEFQLRLVNAEKKQIKYNVYTVIMWVLAGGCASMIFAYIVNILFHR